MNNIKKINKEFIKITNVNIEYRSYSPHVNAPAFVLIHGAASNSSEWIKLMRFIANADVNYSIFSLSLPGHGESENANDYSLNAYSKVLYDFINKKKLKKIIPVGFSFGGMIILNAYFNYPDLREKIESFIFISSGLYFKKIVDLKSVFLHDYNQFIDILCNRYLFNDKTDKDIIEYYSSNLLKNKSINKADFKICIKINLTAKIEKISNKTLLLYGENDNLISFKESGFDDDFFSDYQLKILDDFSHVPLPFQYDGLGKIILNFLDNSFDLD